MTSPNDGDLRVENADPSGDHSRKIDLGAWSPVIAFGVMFVLFAVLRPETFLTPNNLITVLNDQSVLAIAAAGLTVVLLTGEFDLSIAATMSISGVLSAGLVGSGLPSHWVVLLVLIIGGAIGAINGLLVTTFRVPALVATLALASVVNGLTLWYTGGSVIFEGIPPEFLSFGRAAIGRIQTPIMFMVLISFLLWLILKYTALGRSLHAIGGNRDAARMSGIRVGRRVAITFIVAGFCAAFAGVLQAARNGSAIAFMGDPFLLPAFAAAFLGSVTLRRGEFHILGTIIGVYFVAFGSNGLFILGFPFWVEFVFSGLILIVATASSRALQKKA